MNSLTLAMSNRRTPTAHPEQDPLNFAVIAEGVRGARLMEYTRSRPATARVAC